eukprot:4368920-Karenia_brevis.AAC.1
MRDLAMEKIGTDRPMVVMLSPMCGPFSTLQNINYPKMPEDEVRSRLRYGIRHLYFAMDICELQVKQGRYFAFEHPKTASSWNLPGVRKIDIDMCMFGMMTTDDSGVPGHAKKSTTIM